MYKFKNAQTLKRFDDIIKSSVHQYGSWLVVDGSWLTVDGSWLPVKTSTIINLSSHHFQPFCSTDDNVIFWFKGYNHTFLWGLALLIACVAEPWLGGKVNEDFYFKPLYNLHNSISYFHYKELL